MRVLPWLVLLAMVACSKEKDAAPAPVTDTPSTAPPVVPPSTRPKIETTITSTDATHFEVETDAITQALLYGMAGDLTVDPVAGGYRIADYLEGGIFSRLGLARGDVVKSINGVAITGSDALLGAYAAARIVKSVEVGLERAGQPVLLTYRIGIRYDAPPPDPSTAREPSEDELALDKAIKKIDDETYEVERSVLVSLFDSGSSPQARIVPSIKDGKANGFKLYAIRPYSKFAKLGFQNGDTIHAVNGKDLSTPEDLFSAIADIKTVDKVVFDLTRRGKPSKLTLLVRKP